MLWLRAYARKRRWDKEIELVPFEMDCAVRSFGSKARDWEAWTAESQTSGHSAFGFRQVAMWQSLKDHASSAFAAVRSISKP